MTVYLNPKHGNDETGIVTAVDLDNFNRPFKTLEALLPAVAAWRAEDRNARAKTPVRVVETHRQPQKMAVLASEGSRDTPVRPDPGSSEE